MGVRSKKESGQKCTEYHKFLVSSAKAAVERGTGDPVGLIYIYCGLVNDYNHIKGK